MIPSSAQACPTRRWYRHLQWQSSQRRSSSHNTACHSVRALPLAPVVPAFAVRKNTSPLEVPTPSPPNATTLPPVDAELEPADTNTPPPDKVPDPPVKLTRPARPAVEALVPSISAPLLPVFDVPELNTSIPLAPPAPPFALRITTLPLLVCVPSPLINTSEPPVRIVLRPPITLATPPAPLVPLPTLTVTAPPVPPVAAPE